MYVLVEPIPGLKKEISNLRYFFMSKDKRKYYKKQGTITYADYRRVSTPKQEFNPQRMTEEQRRQAYRRAREEQTRLGKRPLPNYKTDKPHGRDLPDTGMLPHKRQEEEPTSIPLLDPLQEMVRQHGRSGSMGDSETTHKTHAHHKPSDDSSHNSHHTHHDYGHSSDSTHHNSGSSSYDSGGSDSGGCDGECW